MNRKEISELLMKAGIKPSSVGFDYIIDAVKLIENDRSYIHLIAKRLYPAIAEKYGINPKNVERNIRGAVASACNHDKDNFDKVIFGSKYRYRKQLPSNAEFLAVLSESMRYQDSNIEEKADGLICKKCEYYNNSNCICNFKGDKTWHYIDGKRRSCDRFIERRKNNE